MNTRGRTILTCLGRVSGRIKQIITYFLTYEFYVALSLVRSIPDRRIVKGEVDVSRPWSTNEAWQHQSLNRKLLHFSAVTKRRSRRTWGSDGGGQTERGLELGDTRSWNWVDIRLNVDIWMNVELHWTITSARRFAYNDIDYTQFVSTP